MTRFTLTLTAALLASATAVTAMEGLDLDIDRDGFATKDEIKQILGGFTPSDFNKLDLNDDNRLSAPELQAPGTRGIIARYESSMFIVHGVSDIDGNNDNFLSKGELQVAYEGLNDADFRDIDTNDDNRVSAKELYAPRSQAVVTRYKMAPNMQVTLMDVDGDGDFFASYDELKTKFPGLSKIDFNNIDMNDDQRVHSIEFYGSDAQVIFDRSGS